MKDIPSFKLNHDIMKKGFYLIGEANGVYTYDLRFRTPNGGEYLDNATMHSIEHMFASVARNSELQDKVVYFGPMGCRTGFYLLLFGVEREEALAFTKKCLQGCLKLTEVPGTKKKQCGNYEEHSYHGAIRAIYDYISVLQTLS